MVRAGRQHRGAGEAGFTLIELVIVMLIISALAMMVFVAMNSAKVNSRNEAMKTAAASVDQAVGAFNRIYPPLPAPVGDPFTTRGGAGLSGNTGSPNAGLADETGGWLLENWPENPFAAGGVTLRRYATPAPCNAMGAPGEVRACRSVPGTMTYQIRAFGRDKNGNAIEVYRATHGSR